MALAESGWNHMALAAVANQLGTFKFLRLEFLIILGKCLMADPVRPLLATFSGPSINQGFLLALHSQAGNDSITGVVA